MLVQIYSLTHPADVRACVKAGVDHIGVVGGDQALPAAVSNDRARTLFDAVPSSCRTVALTVDTDIDRIATYAEALNPDILHISAATEAVSVSAMDALQERLSDQDLMKAIDVTDDSAIDAARRFDDVSDWLILDTVADNVTGVGASGETHDWAISRRIVETVETPVILAGGLSPANVGDAIRSVRPAGVDSYTHTSRTEDRKDHDLVRAFVENATAAAREEPPR